MTDGAKRPARSASTSTPAYAELHARSAFSFLRGSSPPDVLATEAANRGLSTLALCDRDGVYGAPRLHAEARDKGVRALVGAEVTLDDGSVLPLLAKSRRGYQNLCALITKARGDPRAPGVEPEPSFDRDDARIDPVERKRPCYATRAELAEHAEGLIALTGDEEGPVRRAWRTLGNDAAAQRLGELTEIYGNDGVYVELQRLLVRGEEREVKFLGDLADTLRLPVLATGGVTHATREHRLVADVFTCLRNHTTLDAAGRLLAPNAERHLKPAATMTELFRARPDAVRNTLCLADRLEFTLSDLGYRFPDFPVAPGETMAGKLRAVAYEGARRRYGTVGPVASAKLDLELALMEELGFSGYFLIVWGICQWAREQNILVQGRGSAANSVVCYCLGITSADPIKHQLLFERFLSRGRIGADGRPSWPDVDLDFPSGTPRERVIQEVYTRYGKLGAAMTANVITYRGRSTARELGKVLGLADDVIDRFSALYANGDFPHTIELSQQIVMAGLPANHPRLPALLTATQQLRGLPRHLGQHPGGMVIAAGRLDHVVPLEPATMPGRMVVQWDKDDCEDLGIVKIDFLGLGMMAVLQDTFELCQANGRGPTALHAVDQEDKATYAAMQRADTIGVFQIESRAQMSSIRRFKPATFYDVAMQVSIVRPGPIVGKVAHPLLRRRAGVEDIECIDPSVHEILLPVLHRTYGVILFQEQMLQVAMKLADFSGAEAEELRRAMGFTRGTERLARVLAKLRERMRGKGYTDAVVDKIIDSAKSFALYGFPEAHAISFGLLAYVSTWLKVHRPAEFLAGLLNNQPMGFYSPATLVQDARRHGVNTKPVCVLRSTWGATVENDKTVRLGLLSVKGLREAPVQAMVAARTERPFASLDDWLRRTSFTVAERRALAAVGALNGFAGHRRAAMWQVEAAWSAEETLLHQFAAATDLADEEAKREQAESGEQRAERAEAGGRKSEVGNRTEKPEARSQGPGERGRNAKDEFREEGKTGQRSDEVSETAPDSEALGSPLSATSSAASVADSPLLPMSLGERYRADFSAVGLTTGEHPMAMVRAQLPDVWRAGDLPLARDGQRVTIGGAVICRQRPGTAKGVVFISLEDETGVANAIVRAELFEKLRLRINEENALRITGRFQNQEGVIHILAEDIQPLGAALPEQASHDFH